MEWGDQKHRVYKEYTRKEFERRELEWLTLTEHMNWELSETWKKPKGKQKEIWNQNKGYNEENKMAWI